MRYFVYFRNTEYAKLLAGQSSNTYIKKTESEILGIDALEQDVFIIDAHQGGEMYVQNGLKTALKILDSIRTINAKILILSWFPEEYVLRTNQIAKELASSNKIEFLQLPKFVSDEREH